MRTELRMGGETAFRLQHALLVYGDGRRHFATLHEPVGGTGAPTLGPGSPISSTFLRKLSDDLGAGLPLEVLPPTVLCRTADVTVWWRPSAVAAVFYSPSDKG